jgi:hypothetical protein
MSLVIPNIFVGGAGHKARASEVNTNFQAVSAKFTEGAGGIADGDISTAAGIKGSKISSVAGSRISNAQLEDDAVDLRVLKDDATAGSPNAAVNTSNHIKDGIIIDSKIVAGGLKKVSLALASVLVAMPAISQAARASVDTTLIPSTALPVGWFSEYAGAVVGSVVVLELHLDTAANKFYLVGVNANIGGANSPAFNIRVWYITI